MSAITPDEFKIEIHTTSNVTFLCIEAENKSDAIIQAIEFFRDQLNIYTPNYTITKIVIR